MPIVFRALVGLLGHYLRAIYLTQWGSGRADYPARVAGREPGGRRDRVYAHPKLVAQKRHAAQVHRTPIHLRNVFFRGIPMPFDSQLDTAPSLDISAPQIVLVAAGETPSAQANARGHLFERFMARLFEAHGCDPPTSSNVTVPSNGYELDIATKMTLSQERAVAECKAYSSPLASKLLSTFYGKLHTERLDHPGTHGWFVAIPGLTTRGHELARKLEAGDPKFRLITAEDIFKLATAKEWVKPLDVPDFALLSDQAILLTDASICSMAKQLDSVTRLPIRVLVQRSSGLLSAAELELLSSTDYVAGMPVQDCGASPTAVDVNTHAEVPTLVTVVGSSGDFEYQFPAAPKFFVGRRIILDATAELLKKAYPAGKVLVLNAQSGWGKSSLALKIAAQVTSAGGHATVFDSRTANATQYVAASLRQAITGATSRGILSIPSDASFGSLQSAIRTLHMSIWSSPAKPLLVFFDQFENVFRDPRLTQEFRDLALAVREVQGPVLVGFSWKTDLVALTENYPYRLRDEIRGVATVISVEPFGPTDVGTVLNRLAKAAGSPISQDLRQRIREYSQGLPWLLKKLASHILKELQAGTTEETLLEQSLNIEGLFEQDLASLQAAEIDALRLIAKEAPVPVADIVERIESAVIQSLVDQRLLVRVGERLDTYWDIFREFLVTGKVAVEDTYILRQRPRSTSKVLQAVIAAGGEIPAFDVASKLGTSTNVVFNASRELRQLNILSPKAGSLALVEQLRNGPVMEAHLQARVAKALRRHRVFKVIQELLFSAHGGKVTLEKFAAELPTVYPAVAAGAKTWRLYAIAFALWLEYAGLISLRGQTIGHAANRPSSARLLGGDSAGRQKTFPQTRPEAALGLLRARLVPGLNIKLPQSSIFKAVSDLQVLGVVESDGEVRDSAIAHRLVDDVTRAATLLSLLPNAPGGGDAVKLLQDNPHATSEAVGGVLRDAYGLPWVDSTTKLAGAKFRAWAVTAGIKVSVKPKKKVAPIAV